MKSPVAQKNRGILHSNNFYFNLLTRAFLCLQEEAEATFGEQIQQMTP